jgi:hypothetical protein
MENKKGQIPKSFYFIVIRTMELGERIHVDYCLVSEWGLAQDAAEIQTKVNTKAKKIVANLSIRDNVAYHFAGVEELTRAKYNVFKEYVTHYVDESLREYDTSDEQATEEA